MGNERERLTWRDQLEQHGGKLLVAAILALATSFIVVRDSTRANAQYLTEHERRLHSLEEFADKGDRCTGQRCNGFDARIGFIEEQINVLRERLAELRAVSRNGGM